MRPFYVGLAALVEKDEKFLVLKRSSDKDFAPNTWEPVTGRLERGENPEDGILRELGEEIKIKAEVLMPVGTWFFHRGSEEHPMVSITFWCRYVEGEVKLSWEHSEYKWITLSEAIDEPDLEYFRQCFQRIRKLKEHLPNDFVF